MPREVKAFSGTVNAVGGDPGGVRSTIYTVPAGRVAKLMLDSLNFTYGYITRFSAVQKPRYPAGPFLTPSGQSVYPMDSDLAVGALTTSPTSPAMVLRKVCYLVAGESVQSIADTDYWANGYYAQGSYRFVVIEEY